MEHTTASYKPLDRSCISLMRMLANGSKVLKGAPGCPPSAPASPCASPVLLHRTGCLSRTLRPRPWPVGRGHGSRADAIVAHLAGRDHFCTPRRASTGGRRRVRTPLEVNVNEEELVLASARGRRVRRISRPYALAVRRFRANIIQTMNRRRPSAVLVCVPCSSSRGPSGR